MTPAPPAHRRSALVALVAVAAAVLVLVGVLLSGSLGHAGSSEASGLPSAVAAAGASGSGSSAGAGSSAPASPSAVVQSPGPVTAGLAPWSSLDRRWGPYLSEREWGNPREAVNGNGWGLFYGTAIRTEYRFGEDGIAGLEDDRGLFHVAWAFWDGAQKRITERLYGLTNAQGPHGETIAENRSFGEATPTSSYLSYTYHYPTVQPGAASPPPVDTIDEGAGTFTIRLEAARVDDRAFALRATATNTGAAPARLDVVLKGWLAPGSAVVSIPGGIALRGPSSTVALVAVGAPAGVEITADKAGLDADLRADALHQGSGHIGAIDRRAQIASGASASWLFGMAEASDTAAATQRATQVAAEASPIVDARRAEASTVFAGQVSQHADLYRQLLMDTLWSQSYYRWDGSGAQWDGTVDAHDVLIMPDKWEFPWPASWDGAFHAVVASLIDRTLAEDQVRFFLSPRWQQPDGHVPCAEWVMADECPPIFGWAAWRASGDGADVAFLRDMYPRLGLQYRYWQRQLQDPTHPGLYTGGFLGLDNLPRSGGGQPQADASGWMAAFARDMARIARALGDGPAALRYEADLATTRTAVNRYLWNDAAGIYEDLGAGGTGFVDAPSYAGLVPLIAGIVPADREQRLLDALRDPGRFLSPHGLRSLSKSDPRYQPGYASAGAVNSNWLGPVWLPLNYLLVQAIEPLDASLATQIRDRVVATVEADWRVTGHVHEYYDAETGQGLGADEQTGWTALAANLIREGWPAGP